MSRVAFVHGDFPFGGAEMVTMKLLKEMKGCYDFYVITSCYHPDSVGNYDLEKCAKVLTPKAISNHKSYCEFILGQVKKYEIGLVVCVSMVGLPLSQLTWVCNELRQIGCKVVNADHSMPFWDLIRKQDNAKRKKQKGIGSFFKYYLLQYPKYEMFPSLIVRKLEKQYLKIISNSDAYTVLTEGYKNDLVSKIGNSDKIWPIQNMEEPKENINLNKENIFLYVGRLSYVDKRVDRLLDAWKIVCEELSDWKLLIVGDGDEANRLKAMSANLPHVCFEGFRNNTEPYYQSSSALCLTSSCESWGLCLTEAQSYGVVPIAMNASSGVSSVIGETGGFLVEKGNVKDLADKMLYFAHLSENEKQRLRECCVEKSKEYAPNVVVAKWRELFDTLLKK